MRIDQLYENPDGVIHIRIVKSDGGYHRTTIPPGIDPDLQMALVNAHLVAMGVDSVPMPELDRVRSECARAHTPARIAAYRATQRAREDFEHGDGG